jgi:hypothetical protein
MIEPTACALHCGNCCPCSEKHAGRVDIHDVVPLFERLLGQPGTGGEARLNVQFRIAARDAGDVAQDIQPAIGLLGLANDHRPLGFITDVLIGECCGAAAIANLVRYPLAQARVAVAQQHPGAVQSEQPGCLGSNS